MTVWKFHLKLLFDQQSVWTWPWGYVQWAERNQTMNICIWIYLMYIYNIYKYIFKKINVLEHSGFCKPAMFICLGEQYIKINMIFYILLIDTMSRMWSFESHCLVCLHVSTTINGELTGNVCVTCDVGLLELSAEQRKKSVWSKYQKFWSFGEKPSAIFHFCHQE